MRSLQNKYRLFLYLKPIEIVARVLLSLMKFDASLLNTGGWDPVPPNHCWITSAIIIHF
jgi:hypothetical protein